MLESGDSGFATQLTVMNSLRRTTSSRHQALEARLNLLRPGLTLTEYCELLKGFGCIYRAWEPLAESLIEPAIPGLTAPRQKSAFLENDLAFFGVQRRATRADLPGFATPAAALGAMYVLEGATL